MTATQSSPYVLIHSSPNKTACSVKSKPIRSPPVSPSFHLQSPSSSPPPHNGNVGQALSPSQWFNLVRQAFQRSTLAAARSLFMARQQELAVLEQFWNTHSLARLSAKPKSKPSSKPMTRAQSKSTATTLSLGQIDSESDSKSVALDSTCLLPSSPELWPGCLYVSGPPGSGKSAFISAFIEEKKSSQHQILFLNCMTLNDPKKLQRLLFDTWAQSPSRVPEEIELLSLLRSVLVPSHVKEDVSSSLHVLVLDEMDQLLPAGESLLYTLMKWSSEKGSRLLTIGVANAIDLIEKWSPRFRAEGVPPPHTLFFSPYSHAQLTVLLQNRMMDELQRGESNPLSTDTFKPALTKPPMTVHASAGASTSVKVVKHLGWHPVALELVARKVASLGDTRKALDLCRLTVEVAERDYYDHLCHSQSALSTDKGEPGSEKEKENLSSLTARASTPPSSQPSYLVSLSHVQKAIGMAFGSPQSAAILDLNLHQQLTLAALVLLKREGRESHFATVHLKYSQLCSGSHAIRLTPLTRSEFQDTLVLMEGRGLLQVGLKPALSVATNTRFEAPRGRKRRADTLMDASSATAHQWVSLKVSEAEIIKGTQQVSLVAQLLDSKGGG